MKAMELFNEEEVLANMNQWIRARLWKLPARQLSLMEYNLMLGKGFFGKLLYDDNSEVDMSLFDKLCSALGISIFKLFGKPKWNPEKREYWMKESQKHPIYWAINAGAYPGDKAKPIPLNMYVIFRAANELRSNSKRTQ